MKESLVKDNTGQGVRPAGKSPIRFGTVNVGTISVRANEIASLQPTMTGKRRGNDQ